MLILELIIETLHPCETVDIKPSRELLAKQKPQDPNLPSDRKSLPNMMTAHTGVSPIEAQQAAQPATPTNILG